MFRATDFNTLPTKNPPAVLKNSWLKAEPATGRHHSAPETMRAVTDVNKCNVFLWVYWLYGKFSRTPPAGQHFCACSNKTGYVKLNEFRINHAHFLYVVSSRFLLLIESDSSSQADQFYVIVSRALSLSGCSMQIMRGIRYFIKIVVRKDKLPCLKEVNRLY